MIHRKDRDDNNDEDEVIELSIEAAIWWAKFEEKDTDSTDTSNLEKSLHITSLCSELGADMDDIEYIRFKPGEWHVSK